MTIAAPDAASSPTGHGEDLADAIAAAVLAVPGVVDLHTGTFGEVATYLPGRRVNGVRVRGDGIEVHLVLRFGAPVLDTAEAVRHAVQALTPGPVDVAVQDVVEDVPDAPPAAGPGVATVDADVTTETVGTGYAGARGGTYPGALDGAPTTKS